MFGIFLKLVIQPKRMGLIAEYVNIYNTDIFTHARIHRGYTSEERYTWGAIHPISRISKIGQKSGTTSVCFFAVK